MQGVRGEWGDVAAELKARKAMADWKDEIARQAKKILARGDAGEGSTRSVKDENGARVAAFEGFVASHRAANEGCGDEQDVVALENYGARKNWSRMRFPDLLEKARLMRDDPDVGRRPKEV